MSHVSRNHGAPWSDKDNAYLRDKWGKVSIRVLRDVLGRHESSIYRHAINKPSAYGLGLSPVSKLRKTEDGIINLTSAAYELTMARSALVQLCLECGVKPHPMAPVQAKKRKYKVLGVVLEQVRLFRDMRNKLTDTPYHWSAKKMRATESYIRNRMARLGIAYPVSVRPRCYVPKSVLAVVSWSAARKPRASYWCRLWEFAIRVLGPDRDQWPCHPWFMTLTMDALITARRTSGSRDPVVRAEYDAACWAADWAPGDVITLARKHLVRAKLLAPSIFKKKAKPDAR